MNMPPMLFGAANATHADPIEQLDAEDRADFALLRLVLCAVLATVVLALASALQF